MSEDILSELLLQKKESPNHDDEVYDWYNWRVLTKKNLCLDESTSNIFEFDFVPADKLNKSATILPIDWQKIEPEKDRFNDEYIIELKRQFEAMPTSQPVILTLLNGSNPTWFDNQGGWESLESVDLFERYTEFVCLNFLPESSLWVTMFEPNLMLDGKAHDIYIKSARNLIKAHIKSYRKIHEIAFSKNISTVAVGYAPHLRLFTSRQGSFLDNIAIKNAINLFQDVFTQGMTIGKFVQPLGKGFPYSEGRYFDFIAIMDMSHVSVKFSFVEYKNGFAIFTKPDVNILSQLGAEQYKIPFAILCKNNFDTETLYGDDYIPVFIIQA